MFNKKDYLEYFNQLYKVEIAMKEEADELLKIVDKPEAKALIVKIREDEIRHANLVKEMIKLV